MGEVAYIKILGKSVGGLANSSSYILEASLPVRSITTLKAPYYESPSHMEDEIPCEDREMGKRKNKAPSMYEEVTLEVIQPVTPCVKMSSGEG